MRPILVPLVLAIAPMPVIAQTPLDVSAASLSQSDLSNVQQLYERLLIPAKGEFESTGEYQERARAAAPDGFVAVSIQMQGAAADAICWEATARYDADTESMSLSLPLDKEMINADAVMVRCESAAQGSYSASNAFGATAQVREFSETIYLVRVTDLPPRYGTRRFESIAFTTQTFQIPRDEARELSPNLRLALVFKPVLPPPDPDLNRPGLEFLARPWLAFADTTYQSPTINNPRDLTTVQHFVSAEDVAVWIYDSRSGRVVRKLRLSEP